MPFQHFAGIITIVANGNGNDANTWCKVIIQDPGVALVTDRMCVICSPFHCVLCLFGCVLVVLFLVFCHSTESVHVSLFPPSVFWDVMVWGGGVWNGAVEFLLQHKRLLIRFPFLLFSWISFLFYPCPVFLWPVCCSCRFYWFHCRANIQWSGWHSRESYWSSYRRRETGQREWKQKDEV